MFMVDMLCTKLMAFSVFHRSVVPGRGELNQQEDRQRKKSGGITEKVVPAPEDPGNIGNS